MAKRTAPFRIEFIEQADRHVASLTARQRATVLETIEEQLLYEPALPTRNRKRLRENSVAQYSLRVADMRVYYDVVEAERLVLIKAVAVKVRDRVFAGGEELDL